MKDAEARLKRDRALRDRAWSVLRQQVDQVRADLSAKGVGSRAASTVAEEARGAADASVSVARDNKAIVAGTIGALVVWLFRDPIWRGLTELFGPSDGEDAEGINQDGEPDRDEED